MFKTAAIAVSSVLFMQAAMADDSAKVVGIWKLVSLESEFQDGSARRPTFGAKPTGYIIFTAQGRMMTVIEGEGRKVASTDEERAGPSPLLQARRGPTAGHVGVGTEPQPSWVSNYSRCPHVGAREVAR